MIVLDTTILSELMRASPHPGVVAWVDHQARSTLFVTTLTLAEIRFGIAALPRGRRRSTLHQAFENGIRPLLADRVLAFDEAAATEYATLRAAARAVGTTVSDADALIAATTSAHQFAIATRDGTPFQAMGLHVINPFE
ncbi:MAG: type II toxin-antitoxin system VapC family toxin [Dermatophilaceae bacterium]